MTARAVSAAVLMTLAAQAAGAETAADAALLDQALGFVITNQTPVRDDPSNRLARDPVARDLGRALFFDAGLSADGTVACASCHVTDGAFTPNESRPAGASRDFRSVMPVLGAVNQSFFFWDGRKDSLWSQALGPLENPDEHGLTRTQVVAYVLDHYPEQMATLNGGPVENADTIKGLPAASPLGGRAVRAAWAELPDEIQAQVNGLFALVGKSIAAFETALPLPASEWDRLILNADESAVPDDVLRGFALFTGKARCSTCHSGPLFTDYDFHNTGLPPVAGHPLDLGRQAALMGLAKDEFNCLGPHSDAAPADCKDLTYLSKSIERAFGTFRTPSLRGVGRRAVLGHAGQMADLQAMLDHYNAAPAGAHGAMLGVETLSELVPLGLSEGELADLLAFLETL